LSCVVRPLARPDLIGFVAPFTRSTAAAIAGETIWAATSFDTCTFDTCTFDTCKDQQPKTDRLGRGPSRQSATVSQTARVPSITTWTRVPGSANAEPAPDTCADTSVSSTSRRVVTTEVAP